MTRPGWAAVPGQAILLVLAACACAGVGLAGTTFPDTTGLTIFPAGAMADCLPDSTAMMADTVVGYVEPIEVVGTVPKLASAPARVHLDDIIIRGRDAQSAADLGPVLPATRVGVNSRGESQFMIRGAPERHVRVFLDGIPLNVPWDERVDLSMVPVDAIEQVKARRGMFSVLDGPNALAGTVELLPPEAEWEGRRTKLSLQAGESSFAEGRLVHQVRRGSWHLLAALARRERSGFFVPEGVDARYHQGSARRRTNSDLQQASLMLRVGRTLGERGSLRLTFAGADGGKGVPPETHLASGARFWRYPQVRRGLLGLSLRLPLGEAGRWDLTADLTADRFEQQIRKFDDASYTGPALTPGVDFETDRDWTEYARLHVTHRPGPGTELTLQTVARYTRHRESLVVDGPETDYAQIVGSLVAEIVLEPHPRWRLRAGGGHELATTPETGAQPERGPTEAPVLHLRAEHLVNHRLTLHAAASRRSRFPALRELYSGALGRFVPNPDLAPERQDLLSLGGSIRNGSWEATVTGFAGTLAGGIEKVVLPGEVRQFQRRNVDRIRTLGVELVVAVRPWTGVMLSAHHTILNARQRVDGSYDAPAEDRPDYLSFLSVSWTTASGWQLGAEAAVTGARHSVDVTDEHDGLRRLPVQAAEPPFHKCSELGQRLRGAVSVGVALRQPKRRDPGPVKPLP